MTTMARNRGAALLLYVLVAIEVMVGMGNGLFMLIAPEFWYYSVPGVVQSGLYNQHFIRDIGIIYIFIGLAFAIGLVKQDRRIEFWGAASLWLAAHAVFHFWEVAVGICSASAIPRDFPGVTLPALIGLTITAWAWRSHATYWVA
jgi:hypothetical protein